MADASQYFNLSTNCFGTTFKILIGNDLSPKKDLCGIDALERCQDILQRHNWDIEVAVQARFAEEEGRQNIFHEPRREARTPPVDVQPIYQRVYTVSRRPQPQGIMGWGYFLILFPFRFVYSSLMDILKFAYRLLRPDPRRTVTDPVGDVTSFIQSFEETFGETHPNFYAGSYRQALNEAKQELKFLLVYLHGDDHQDTADFCSNTLCDPTVITFFNETFIFWACNTNSPEGYRVSQALRENTYPFLALIVLRNGRMTVVARIEGPMESTELIGRLTRIVDDNEIGLVAARSEREERNFNQTLRNQQDEAYMESLKADQEKARKKQEAALQREREEQEEQDKRDEEVRRIEERERRKDEIRAALPDEPDQDNPDVIKVLLKLPNGTRLERRFLKTYSLKVLYEYVFVHEAAPDDFQIVTNFPRKVLPCEPTTDNPNPPTFAESGLGKSEMLFVHDNEA